MPAPLTTNIFAILDAGYYTKAQADGRYAPLTHSHALADITDLASLAVTQSQVTGLPARLTGIDDSVTAANATAGTALDHADSAASDAAAAQSTANAAGTLATLAKSTADTAVTNAAAAQSSADTANSGVASLNAAKGAPNGLATLTGAGVLPTAQLPPEAQVTIGTANGLSLDGTTGQRLNLAPANATAAGAMTAAHYAAVAGATETDTPGAIVKRAAFGQPTNIERVASTIVTAQQGAFDIVYATPTDPAAPALVFNVNSGTRVGDLVEFQDAASANAVIASFNATGAGVDFTTGGIVSAGTVTGTYLRLKDVNSFLWFDANGTYSIGWGGAGRLQSMIIDILEAGNDYLQIPFRFGGVPNGTYTEWYVLPANVVIVDYNGQADAACNVDLEWANFSTGNPSGTSFTNTSGAGVALASGVSRNLSPGFSKSSFVATQMIRAKLVSGTATTAKLGLRVRRTQ